MNTNSVNSNEKTRRQGITKAILLLLFPMFFTAMATTLLIQVDKVDANKIGGLESELSNIKNERTVFFNKIKKIEESWKKYQTLLQEWIDEEGDMTSSTLYGKIESKEKSIKNQLTHLETILKDTVFSTIYHSHIQSYRSLINHAKTQTEDKKNLASCLDGKGSDSILSTRIETLENEKFELQKELLDLKSAGNTSKTQDIELRKLENQNFKNEQNLNILEDKYEHLKEEKEALAMGYNMLFDEAIRGLDDMEIKGFCNKSKFKKAKAAIIKTINDGKRDLNRP